jgi:hypothetical protein
MPAVYIAGPMRGYDKHNFPAFDAAAALFTRLGYAVFNPADFDREVGLTEDSKDSDVTPAVLRKCMRSDLTAITAATHIALLPGWEGSSGCRSEIMLADTLGLEFLDGSNGFTLSRLEVGAVVGALLVVRFTASRDKPADRP